MDAATAWLVATMAAFAPPERASVERGMPGWSETKAQREERYGGIAEAIARVVSDPDEKPVFGGEKGRARTAALLAAIAWHESGFARDVDIGPCYRGRANDGARCDHGRAACLMQIHVNPDGRTLEGWTKEELFADRTKCFRAGLHLLQKSFASCKANPPKHRLAAFASGRCSAGQSGSEKLLSLGERFSTRIKGPRIAARAADAPAQPRAAGDPARPFTEALRESP